MDISFLGIFLGVVAYMTIGSLWYSPLLFRNTWVTLLGWSKEEAETRMKNEGMKSMFLGIITAFLTSFAVAYLQYEYLVLDVVGAICLALVLFIGFIVPVTISSVIWEGRPWKLFFLNTSNYLVSLIIMSIVVFLF